MDKMNTNTLGKDTNVENKLNDLFGLSDGVYSNKAVISLHTIYISGEIEGAEEYSSIFETIRNAPATDVIKIHINSHGGDLFTAVQFMRVMAESEATIVASVEGACMSAATLIFLAAERFEISEHSVFMFHNYSTMMYGKGGELYDNIMHDRQWSENLLRRTYQGFLTEAEIASILDNKDIWMGHEEAGKRLEKYVSYREKKNSEQNQPVTKPKKPRKTLDNP